MGGGALETWGFTADAGEKHQADYVKAQKINSAARNKEPLVVKHSIRLCLKTIQQEDVKRRIIAATTNVKGIFPTLRRGRQFPCFTVLVKRGVQGMEAITPTEFGALLILDLGLSALHPSEAYNRAGGSPTL